MTINENSIESWKAELARASNKAEEDAKTIQSLKDELESCNLNLKAHGVPPMLLDQAG